MSKIELWETQKFHGRVEEDAVEQIKKKQKKKTKKKTDRPTRKGLKKKKENTQQQ